ncbi:MAG: ComEC/Rec2 family competence protein, partial [Kiritimatiellia bacterium]|nr:ComEC/Rec2 family competence protein [Kiritimatiellia bacterium]
PSAVRAVLMAFLYYSASAIRRKPDGATALAWAAVVSVSLAPRQILEPGFVYSFSVVAGLLAALPALADVGASLSEGDPLRIDRPGMLIRAWRWLVKNAVDLVRLSFVAWMVSTPLTLWYSNRLSPVALIGNVFMVPAAFLLVLTGSLSLAAGAVSPFLAEVFNHASRTTIDLLGEAARNLGQLPGAYFYVPRPSPVWIAGGYAACMLLLFLRGAPRRWVLAGMLGLAGWVGAMAWMNRDLRVETWESGPAATTLIHRPFRAVLVCDPGPRYRATALVRELRARGVNRIDILILRVPLLDWSSAAVPLADALPIGEIWVPAELRRFPAFRNMLDELAPRGIPMKKLSAGDHFFLKGGMEADVFHPAGPADSSRAGDASLALRVALDRRAVFVGGPGTSAWTKSVLSAQSDPRASDLLLGIVPGDSAGWPELLDAIGPEEVRFMLPATAPLRPEWTEPLSERGVRGRRHTDPQGETPADQGMARESSTTRD